ncbi:alpha/beta hydrolase [Arthrobacter sp. UYCu712]|uniref:alpha/beta fold hydrolase n=1 Tax=Arthrobacter sp. UYCu712 TaxID=3156340 RepID=UPI00339864D3
MDTIKGKMNDPGTVIPFTVVTLGLDDAALTALARSGQGVPIVVVHGVMADAFAWKQVAKDIAPERPVFLINRRGRVPSASLNETYGVETEVQDLLRWLATVEGPVDLVGHSYGGLIAVEAIRQGANVRSLVLYEPVAYPFGVEALPLVTAAVSSGDLDAAVEIINVDLSGYDRAHVETLRSGPAWPKLMELAAPASAELLSINHFVFTAPGSWATPTTLIAGELSRNRPPYGPSVDMFLQALNVEGVTILADQDHLAHVTSPQDLAQAINEGLATG